jgi:orotidine-5'-phosphate decarboxylase
MTEKCYQILFLCSGNSARSILAEAILNRVGHGRFRAFSAGSHPKGRVHPLALDLLKGLNFPTAGLRSKSWDEFSGPGAPPFDLVFTVCDNAAAEACPIWPSQPVSVHWGLPDPAAVDGDDGDRMPAFRRAFETLEYRIAMLMNLPMASLDRLEIKARLEGIGRAQHASLSRKPIPPEERLIVALDVPGASEAKALVGSLGDAVMFYKLGLELCMSGSYFDLIEWLLSRKKKVFADLKFFDVPETVGRAVRRLKDRGVHFATVHGNDAMLEAAVREKSDLKILAVTVLTSLDQRDLEDLGFQCDVERLVLSRAKRALAIGCDGVISSGLEAPKLRAELGERLLVVTPGIRPVENRPTDDQKRVVDVNEAFGNGADHIVVGRPIRDAKDPRAAAEEMQATIRALFSNTPHA